jgi:hypothetical protein
LRKKLTLLKRVLTRFTGGLHTELLFMDEMQRLCGSEFEVIYAGFYTGSEKEFKGADRIPQSPTDFLIKSEKLHMIIAAVDTTTGKSGYSLTSSRSLPVSEDKLKRTDRFAEGYVVYRILKGEPRWVWAKRVDVRVFDVTGLDEIHWTTKDIWHHNLETLLDEFRRCEKHIEKLIKS